MSIHHSYETASCTAVAIASWKNSKNFDSFIGNALTGLSIGN